MIFNSKEIDEEQKNKTYLYIDFVDDELSISFDDTQSSDIQLKIFVENLYVAISNREMVKIKQADE